jgi:nucleoside-diphosphate-sugar epimerase
MSDLHVIFGSGPLGQSIARELLVRGKRVRMVNRSGKHPADLPGSVEMMPGDAYNLDFTRQATAGADVVYQCAQPPYHCWPAEFPALQAAILEGAAAAGAKLVAGENLYMYGEVDGPIHEGLPYAATTRKGKVRGEMARSLLEAHRSGKIRVALGRGADFYGPGVLESTMGARAIRPALQGKPASLMGNIDLPHTYTYIEDFGRALVILGEREDALGQAWHVPSPVTLTQRELMTLFFHEMKLPPKMSGMGRGMLAFGGLFVPAARESLEMMYEFEKPFVMNHGRFARAFGDISTPHEDAVRRTVEWFKSKELTGH